MGYLFFKFIIYYTESGRINRKTKQFPSKTTGNLAIDSYDYDMLIARKDLAFDVRTKDAYAQRLAALTAERDHNRTDKLLTARREAAAAKKLAKLEQRHAGAYTESAIIGELRDQGAGMTDVHENVTDHVGEEVVTTKVGVPLHSTAEGTETEYSLNTFFERPFSIYDAAWTTDTEYNIALKVWNLWSKKPAVRNKLSNYAYFRGKLHVKIALSGTPFHYGRLLCSYQPYAAYNENLRSYDSMLQATSPDPNNTRILYKSYLSQAPGAKTMDIKENQPMEIEIPFISYKQKFRLFNDANTVITNSTDFYDFYEAGELRLTTLNRFKVANADYSGPVSINVYAWCTDVELGTITGTNIDITAESAVIRTEAKGKSNSKGSDQSETSPMYSGEGNFGSRLMESIEKGGTEYAEPGPVTKVATAVASAGESLKDVPFIGGFAKATSTIAKGVSKVASLFGWSKPEILDKASFVKNQPFQNGAVLSGHQTEYKIACDPKCELTVDPTIGGVDCDDMAISTLCAKKSYIGSFDWKDSDVAMTDILWRAGISPMMGVFLEDAPGSPGNVNFYQDSAMAFAARPFNYWRGNIKLSFEIVCSKFHRGKLLFRYEPNSSQYGLISSSPAQMNQQNTTILDIQNGQQITFDIDWAHERSWAAVPYNAVNNYKNHYSNDCRGDRTTAYIPKLDASSWDFFGDELNGVLEVRVLNELVQPTNLSDVTVNVYAWSDEITFAFPCERRLPHDRSWTAGSGTMLKTTESAVIGTTPVTLDNSEEKIVENSANMDHVHLDHMGEKVVSLRALLKRFVTSFHYGISPTTSGKKMINYVGTIIPWSSTTPEQGVYFQNDDFNETTLFNYMRFSYMGYRGAIKHRIRLFGDSGPNTHDYLNVRLLSPDSSSDYTELGLSDWSTDTKANLINPKNNFYDRGPIYASMTNRLEGGINFHHESNGGVEFTIPYYSTNLFQFSFCSNPNGHGLDEVGGMQKYYPNKFACAFTTYSGGANLTVADDVAIGEDFTFFRFQGASPFGSTGGVQG